MIPIVLARLAPNVRCVMELRSIDTIVSMVSAGLGVSVVRRPRRALLEAHAVRVVRASADPGRLGRSCRCRTSPIRNIDAIRLAFASVCSARDRMDRGTASHVTAFLAPAARAHSKRRLLDCVQTHVKGAECASTPV